MTKLLSAATLITLTTAFAACGGNTPEAQEPEAAVAEERAESAADATEENTDRAENAADKAEDNADTAADSAEKAEKSADESKK
ncbi:MAG TPA: hypothetical protein VK524_31430 [Polyangiaceae bacterium]|nr:hypothetical protein [Polyangiaceae bacterium]